MISLNPMERSKLERFEEKVEKLPVECGCWIWMAATDTNGYGGFCWEYTGEVRNGKQIWKRVTAHRASYMLFRGEIPDGLEVCHSCHVRCCVNPDHLYLGTHQENCDDRARAWRGRKSKSGLPYGVVRRATGRPYGSKVTYHGKSLNLGSFSSSEEAHAVALAKHAELYSEVSH